jgi:hypothetical protein
MFISSEKNSRCFPPRFKRHIKVQYSSIQDSYLRLTERSCIIFFTNHRRRQVRTIKDKDMAAGVWLAVRKWMIFGWFVN